MSFRQSDMMKHGFAIRFVRILYLTLMFNSAIAREILGLYHKKHSFLHSSTLSALKGKQQNQKQNLSGIFNSSKNDNVAMRIRGGACSDSNPVLFLKIGLSAILETTLMASLILFSQSITEKYPEKSVNIIGLPAITWLSLIAVIFASSFFGSIVDGGLSAATRQLLDPNAIAGDADWYDKLIKPSWNPPGWLFPIMWLIVSKPTQLIALSTLLKDDSDDKFLLLLVVTYCTHLSLGDAWNKVFFGLQCTGRGAAVISLFYAMLLISTYLFWIVNKTSGLFMLPTCGWVTVATALNWNIYLANKK